MALTQISTNGIKDANVNTADIAADAVTAEKILDDAVRSEHIADDAVGSAQIADNAVTTSRLADNAVTTSKIADMPTGRILGRQASGTGDPQFLTATEARSVLNVADGANQITISSNADNRVITGSGTANTLNGEANLTYDGNSFISTQTTSTSDCKFILRNSNTPATGSMRLEFHHGTGTTEGTNRFRYGFVEGIRQDSSNAGALGFGTKADNASAPAEKMRLTRDGKLGINTTSPIGTLDIYDGNLVLSKPNASGNERNWRFLNNNVAAGNLGLQVSTAAGGSTFSNVIEIKSNGRVGIGEGTPLATLHIKPPGNMSQLLLEQNNATDGYALFQDGPNGGHLKFMRHINGTETQKLLLRSDGGLCFGTDNAAANALDDYEEGTFTPYIGGSSTVGSWSAASANGGFYIKIGRKVTCWMNVQGSVSGASGSAYVYGLPFSSAGGNTPAGSGNANYSAGTVQYWAGAGVDVHGALIVSGSSRIYFHTDNGSATGGEPSIANQFHNCHVQVSYWVA